ncbi:MAG: anthranilate phosphoribosyltransferase [Chloroflexi bacterium]|nr:anthranilate phosphoribosyltransferase [Chloroflexota bacterium]MBI3930397.1 anthranilate phosphoribosyltransferase [Chloroflexota bacterium]
MIKKAIQTLVSGKSLTMEEAAQVMEEIMEGQVTPAQFGAFVTALRLKGETVEEIAGMAQTMRAKAIRVKVAGPVIDVVGTGGDGRNTFNISTAAALVVAGAGLKVAKHGNRAASSGCGAADVLEALGVKIELTAEQVQRCIAEVGMGFMFAPAFHPAMKYAGPPRREIGIRTVFNILGPLTNPARAGNYLLGIADGSLVEKMALVLQSLGCNHALVVHGEDGLDEISLSGETRVCELKDGGINNYSLSPKDFGLPRASLDSLKGGTAAENATLLRSILSGTPGPQRDVVLMNAAAALLAGDKAKTVRQGMALAKEALDNGQALSRLEQLIKLSQSFA